MTGPDPIDLNAIKARYAQTRSQPVANAEFIKRLHALVCFIPALTGEVERLRGLVAQQPATAPGVRRLRTGTHRSGNIYWAETPVGVDTDDGQVGYIRDGAVARAMVDAYNAWLVESEDEG